MKPVSRGLIWPMMVAVALAGGSYFGAQAWTAHAADTAQSTAAVVPLAPTADLSKVFRSIHDSIKDAVVNINVVKRATTASSDMQPDIPRQFRDMLPPGFEDQFRGPMPTPRMEGTGSGLIVSANGDILTNYHVVDNADDIMVKLNDGREFKAERIGVDPKTDLAVVRIKADHLTYARFGNSDDLQVGDWVLAFGSPFGFSQTMTQGIISAKGRHVPIIAENNPALRGMTYENFLQTDAAINPGNSGGPLVNLKGEVIGINAAIASDTGAYNGVGFSIPSNDAQYVMNSLIEHGKVVRGYVGIMIEDINHPSDQDKALADSLRKQGADKGILVGEVAADGPGAKSGLQAGDVITALNGKPVTDVDTLRNHIARTKPDSTLKLTLWRDGKTTDLTVKVGTQPETLAVAAGPGRPQATSAGGVLGVGVADVDAARAKEGGGPKQGAEIKSVSPNSLAADVGLQPGDVITRLDKTEITSAKQFADAMKSAKLSDGIKLTVRGEDGMDRMVFVQRSGSGTN
jgi:serine protease Do